jgi:hypothetical protein
MKKLVKVLSDWVAAIMWLAIMAFIVMMAIVCFEWWAAILIPLTFFVAGLFVVFIFTIGAYCRYVQEYKKLTGFIRYMSGKTKGE